MSPIKEAIEAPSDAATKLAEMILSDCGHSTAITTALRDRVAQRIDKYTAALAALRSMPQGEPVAWAIFTDAGNARMWTTFQPHVQKLADAEGLTVTPLFAVPQPVDRAYWFALVMGAASEIENAANCLRDPDAKRVALSGAKHYREKAKAALKSPTPPQPAGEVVAMRGDYDGHGYQYIDAGSGSDWRTRNEGWEPLCTQQHTAPVPDAWQPIETAPKDGTAILVSEGRFIHCVEWNDEYEWWAVDDNKLGPFRLRGTAPTHWMPMPPPPIERAVLGRGGEKL